MVITSAVAARDTATLSSTVTGHLSPNEHLPPESYHPPPGWSYIVRVLASLFLVIIYFFSNRFIIVRVIRVLRLSDG